MDTHSPIRSPSWVRHVDGRLEPFDADWICRTVIQAMQSLDQCDPLLARELTESVLHFLDRDCTDRSVRLEDLTYTTVKVVRELGHPALAHEIQQSQVCRQETDRPRATPELRELKDSGLLHAFDREETARIAAMVVRPYAIAGHHGLSEAIESARERISDYIALDSPEYALGNSNQIASWVRELRVSVRATGLKAVVNLNCATPPIWADDRDGGPLFASWGQESAAEWRGLAGELAERLLRDPIPGVRVDWHFSEPDLEPLGEDWLHRLSRHAMKRDSIAFVADRSRQPIALAEGLDRKHSAIVSIVGMNLPLLLENVIPTVAPDRLANMLAAKIGSLARLALFAGHVRRESIRQAISKFGDQEFLVARARFVVVPMGLASTVKSVTGQFPSAGGPGLDYALQIYSSLNRILQQDSASGPSVLDGPPPGHQTAVDITDTSTTPRNQITAFGTLRGSVDAGTVTVAVARDRSADIVRLLRLAWQKPGLKRIQFINRDAPLRQLTANW